MECKLEMKGAGDRPQFAGSQIVDQQIVACVDSIMWGILTVGPVSNTIH
jgi:hypothetical protein